MGLKMVLYLKWISWSFEEADHFILEDSDQTSGFPRKITYLPILRNYNLNVFKDEHDNYYYIRDARSSREIIVDKLEGEQLKNYKLSLISSEWD